MSYIAYLDCHSGMNADMLLAALFDAGLSLPVLQQRLTLLPLRNYDISLERVVDKGVRGTRVTVTHTIHEPGAYTWAEIETLLAFPHVPEDIRTTTLAVLHHIIDAEKTIHGEKEQVFEIATPSLITLISIIFGLKELGITQLYASALPLTSGYTQTPNGPLAAPTPVTLEILRPINAPWKPCSLEGELVTPLGAALLATLARFDLPIMTLEQVSYGFAAMSSGSLRLYLGMLQAMEQQGSGDADTDWVTVLSTNIDNMSGELLGGLMERLFAMGALDVSYTPMHMKKNRPATMLMLVSPLEKGHELAHLLLRETTTLGVRIQQVQRLKAQRTPQQIDTPLGPMLIKVKRLGTQVISASPEYEECQRIAHERNIPLMDVYAVAQQAIATTIIKHDIM